LLKRLSLLLTLALPLEYYHVLVTYVGAGPPLVAVVLAIANLDDDDDNDDRFKK
jgi:hypothetical protein